MKDDQQKDLNFVLESTSVREITDGDHWDGAEVNSLDAVTIAEIVKVDEKPFFIEFVALYEGLSGNNRKYIKSAVESCAKAMVGVNMYKGHQEPGSESWRYREPVGRIVAGRVSQIEVDGQRVLAAKGKAYITEADTKLRGDIKRNMAGPLSILGDARSIREYGSQERTITLIHNPLKSVDFCNPGSNGMPSAAVTSFVQEMSGNGSNKPPVEEKDQRKPKMDKKLTKEQLLAEYGDEISTIVGEQVKARFDELAAEKANLAEAKQDFATVSEGLKTKITELETEKKDLAAKVTETQKSLDELNGKLMQSDLDNFALQLVGEMQQSEDHDEKVVTIAADGLRADLIDGDLEASKTTFKTVLAGAVEKAEKLIEMAGGKVVEVEEEKTRVHKRNPQKGKKSLGFEDILSPELIEAGKKDK